MSDEGLAFPPVFVNPAWHYREGSAVRPRLPEVPPCEICGAVVATVRGLRICLSCGYQAGSMGF